MGIGQANAAEMGLTPSHVVGLWTNINNCLLTVSQTVVKDDDLTEKLKDMTPGSQTDKKPSDVLGQVRLFSDKVDTIRRKANLKPAKRYKNIDDKITPSVVFLNTGHVLDGVVDWLVGQTDASTLVSPFYELQNITGKTPSDAYAMVELANRRLDALMSKI